MPVIDKTFSGSKNPLDKLSKTLEMLNTSDVDAQFLDKRGKPSITRDYLEMVISEYAVSSQAPQIFNKFLSEDTKLDKALREYKANIAMLLSSVTQQGAMQGSIASQAPSASASPSGAAPAPAPQPAPAPNPQQGAGMGAK